METKNKVVPNIDCNDKTIGFGWSKLINRDGKKVDGGESERKENNVTLMKTPPVCNNEWQYQIAYLKENKLKVTLDFSDIDLSLTSDREQKMFICKALNMAFKESYMHTSSAVYTEKTEKTLTPALVNADNTINISKLDIPKMVANGYKKLMTDEQMITAFKRFGVTEEHLKPYFVALQKETTTPLKQLLKIFE